MGMASLHRLAAIDNDGASDDETCRIGAEPHDRRGDLLRRSHSSNRFLLDHSLSSLSGPTAEGIDRRVQGALYVVASADVARDRACMSAKLLDHARCVVIFSLGHVGHDHPRALA